jgi:hypothetical protein
MLPIAALVAWSTTACTSDVDRFCGQLRDRYHLERLVTAIQHRDQRRITEGLEDLRALEDVAPAEIHDDFRAVVDAVSGAVRAVTKAPGADGEQVPVDLTALGTRLAAIDRPAQHVADYADRKCGLRLNP